MSKICVYYNNNSSFKSFYQMEEQLNKENIVWLKFFKFPQAPLSSQIKYTQSQNLYKFKGGIG